MPIEWMIKEESPIGTKIGNIKEILLEMNNNNSQLIDQLNMNNDSPLFHLNASTGLILSKSRLDYEQKSSYSLLISLEPIELNCSLLIIIKLLNIPDNQIFLDKKSLIYTINENNLIPSYIGRIQLIDYDQLFSFQYKYYLKNTSSNIFIDLTTGSIILSTKLNRKIHGEKLQYEILVIDYSNQRNLTDILIININEVKFFEKDFYQININKSTQPETIIFQIKPFKFRNLTYYIRNSSSRFSIEKSTGNIRLNQYLQSLVNNYTLIIEAIENETNLIDQINIFISIRNDDSIYFNLENLHQCFLNKNQLNGTKICTIGRISNDFIYHLTDPMNLFDIFPNNGTIINQKLINYDTDKHEFNVTITVRDRKKQVFHFFYL